MSSLEPTQDVASILWQASQLAEGDEREAYLNRTCENRPDLRKEVEQLLDELSVDRAGQTPIFERLGAAATNGRLACGKWPMLDALPPLEDEPDADTHGSTEASDTPIGSKIGPYKIREAIGEGGFGVVYVAEQEEPIRRKVAVKLIKPGMDSKQIIARFEAERQALAMMDHPSIAKVLDAGTTTEGRPYFVMELVNGISITDYVEQQQPSLAERLTLFKSICEAVEHAHQKGIIHRDLKPSNVLVTLHDGEPVVKVIDFGVAKALHQRLTENTIYTAMGQMIGTPMYMSPEQAELSGLDVDTRSDVYALGVLLYELLTGLTPFDPESFRQVGYEAMLRMIRETEPPRPSVRVSTAAIRTNRRRIDDQRRVDVKKLSASLSGELDWIVMKSLEKHRERRYQSANALRSDIVNYLSDLPVSARSPSVRYRIRKAVRRNRTGILVALALLAALVTITGSWVWVEKEKQETLNREFAARQQELARFLSSVKQLNTALEDHNWVQARKLLDTVFVQPDWQLYEAEQAFSLTDLSKEVDLLLSIDRARSRAIDWSRSTSAIDVTATDQEYQHAFTKFGVFPDRIANEFKWNQLKDRITLCDSIASVLDEWAILKSRQKSTSEIIGARLFPAVLRRVNTVNDLQNAPAVLSRLQLASVLDSDILRNEIRNLAMQPTSPRKSESLRKLATDESSAALPGPTVRLLAAVLIQDGQRELSIDLFNRAYLERPNDYLSCWQFSDVLIEVNEHERAVQVLSSALGARPNDPALLNRIGNQLVYLDHVGDAIAYYQRCVDVAPSSQAAWSNLAMAFRDRGEYLEAEGVLKRAIVVNRDSDTLWADLSVVSFLQNKIDTSSEALRKALSYAGSDEEVLERVTLAYRYLGRHNKAEILLEEAIDQGVELSATGFSRLGDVRLHQGKPKEALAALDQALTMQFADKADKALVYQHRGHALFHLGREADAVDSFLQGIATDPEVVYLHNDLATVILNATNREVRNLALAEKHARRAVQMHKRYTRAWCWIPFQTLGRVLEAQNRLPEAIDAYEEAQEHHYRSPDFLREKLSRLKKKIDAEQSRTQSMRSD